MPDSLCVFFDLYLACFSDVDIFSEQMASNGRKIKECVYVYVCACVHAHKSGHGLPQLLSRHLPEGTQQVESIVISEQWTET